MECIAGCPSDRPVREQQDPVDEIPDLAGLEDHVGRGMVDDESAVDAREVRQHLARAAADEQEPRVAVVGRAELAVERQPLRAQQAGRTVQFRLFLFGPAARSRLRPEQLDHVPTRSSGT